MAEPKKEQKKIDEIKATELSDEELKSIAGGIDRLTQASQRLKNISAQIAEFREKKFTQQ